MLSQPPPPPPPAGLSVPSITWAVRLFTIFLLVNRCISSPCENGGSCKVTGDSTYRCRCAEGFYGVNCEKVRALFQTTLIFCSKRFSAFPLTVNRWKIYIFRFLLCKRSIEIYVTLLSNITLSMFMTSHLLPWQQLSALKGPFNFQFFLIIYKIKSVTYHFYCFF